jgi:hypothetical protein
MASFAALALTFTAIPRSASKLGRKNRGVAPDRMIDRKSVV